MSTFSDRVWDRIKMSAAYEMSPAELKMAVLGTLYTLDSDPVRSPRSQAELIKELEAEMGITSDGRGGPEVAS